MALILTTPPARPARRLAVGALALVIAAGTAFANDGALDLTWGAVSGGKVIVDIAGGFDTATAALVLPDGSVLLSGGAGNTDFAMVKLKTDGSLDTTFGSGGRVSTPMGGNAFAMARQPDGRLVLGGTSNNDFGLVRYDAAGALDPAFGSGGKVTTDFAGGFDRVTGVAVQPDGKIVVGGYAQLVSGNYAFAAARYMPNGTPDSSFGSGGKVTTGWTTQDIASAMLLEPDGSIVLAGRTRTGGTTSDFALVKYTPAGALDLSFGTGGIVTTDLNGDSDYALALALQPDGRLVAAGYAGTAGSVSRFGLVRYLATGAVDSTFGSGGVVMTTFNGGNCSVSSLRIQSDGKILAAGNTATLNTGLDFAVARYDASGALDPGFGSGGKLTVDFRGTNDQANAVVLDAEGLKVIDVTVPASRPTAAAWSPPA